MLHFCLHQTVYQGLPLGLIFDSSLSSFLTLSLCPPVFLSSHCVNGVKHTAEPTFSLLTFLLNALVLNQQAGRAGPTVPVPECLSCSSVTNADPRTHTLSHTNVAKAGALIKPSKNGGKDFQKQNFYSNVTYFVHIFLPLLCSPSPSLHSRIVSVTGRPVC